MLYEKEFSSIEVSDLTQSHNPLTNNSSGSTSLAILLFL